jgi:ABC transporter fused permease/ATP-binding protein
MSRALGIGRLFSLAAQEKKTLTIGLVALAISSGGSLLAPYLIRQMIDGLTQGGGRAVVDRMALTLLAVFAVSGLFTATRSYAFTVAGERVVARLRADLYQAMMRQEVAFFDERRTGELTSRLASDTTVLQNAVTTNISMLLRFGSMGIGALVILVWTSWQLTLVMLAIVPVVAIGMIFYGRILRALSRKVQDAAARASEVAEETLAGIRTVRAFAAERAETQRYGGAVQEAFDVARQRARLGATFQGVAGFAAYAAIAAVLWVGGLLTVRGEMTFGALTSFLLYTMTVAFSIAFLSGVYEDLMRAVGASERVFQLLDREPQVASGEKRLAEVKGLLKLTDLHFAYPSRPDVKVLDGIDLALKPGEVVALVGPSGGGKSTVAALLSRFYDPSHGSVELDGHDFRTLDAEWLRTQVGVVSQEPVLFATSVIENIRYGRRDASLAEVEAAARAAHIHEFIVSLPEGYQTLVGERGVRLSGGQKQRVAIARALLKDPRLLVLDEATSALDAESEHLVQDALKHLMKGRTTMVIAHRLSTVREADRVVVIDRGQVVQQGCHDELAAIEGLYRALVQRQLAA